MAGAAKEEMVQVYSIPGGDAMVTILATILAIEGHTGGGQTMA